MWLSGFTSLLAFSPLFLCQPLLTPKEVQIGDIAHQVNERNFTDDDLPVLSSTKHAGLVDSLTYFGRQIYSDDRSDYKVVRRWQFAYATNHIEEGSIGYQSSYDAGLVSPMYTVFETVDGISDMYLYTVLKTETYRAIFKKNTSGSVNRRGSLRWNTFKQIRVPLPSQIEQGKISETLLSLNTVQEVYQKLLGKFKEQKRGLMQQLLTGAVRVRVEE